MIFLYVEPRFHPNQYPIIEGLIKKGHQVYFCVYKIGETEKHDGVELFVVNPSKTTIFLKRIWKKRGENYLEDKLVFWFKPKIRQIKEIMKRIQPDVMIIRGRTFFTLAFYRHKPKKTKAILYNQSPIFTKKENVLKRIIRRAWYSLFPKSRFTVSKYAEYPFLNKDYIEDKNAVFLPHVPRQIIDNRDYFSNNIINIFDCGKYRDYKNHFCLVDAISIILDSSKLSNFHVTILGQVTNSEEADYYTRLEKHIKEKEMSNYFSLLTQVPYDEVPKYFLKNDIFILPSKKEEATVSILDAMSYGLATISTSKNGTADNIIPGKNGYVFVSNSASDLADKISIYLNNPQLIAEHGRKSLDIVKSDYTFDKYYKTLISLIKRI